MYTQDKLRWLEKDRAGVSRKEKLLKRQRIVDMARNYFREEGFFEAEIPLLVSGTTPDAGIQSFSVKDRYLTTSTEYHIKRMIAGGFERVFTLTKNFREYEFDATHNPEFTMLEWGRGYASLEVIEQDLMKLLTRIHQALFPHQDYLVYQGSKIDLRRWQTLTFQELLYTQYGIAIPEDYDWGDILSLVEQTELELDPLLRQEPALLLSDLLDRGIKKRGFDGPVWLKKWPAPMSSSGESAGADAKWTHRTELIIGGLEIADGFPFLCNPELQRVFFDQSNARRKGMRLPPVGYDEKYLGMLQGGLCPGAGMALGIDRLCMLLTDSAHIREVLCFAWEEL